ncbi:preprotein translocase Sec, Sec61-beta subunit protein [Actinidia rufa]|uniref:Preprotein translocase Sec, Sec61-beta subunit protein n=1 Tax=Actinidia rufa TaxID=165716 RepID=A0A7J0GR95_9ERIC|nr:preprotein translocase Sec, Sec61-beta subunit protein [Actinidia rufa]
MNSNRAWTWLLDLDSSKVGLDSSRWAGLNILPIEMREKSSTGTGFVAVELTEDVESGEEADEGEAHYEDHGEADLRPRSVIRVEPQHVVSPPPPHPGGCRCGTAGAGLEVENVDAWDWDEPFAIV